MKKILIDVSEHQGVIDWEKTMYHIDGAILRCGYGSDYTHQDDTQFKRNADECTRLGIPFGVYIYSYGKTIDRVKSEAAHVLRLIKPYKLAYPVYLDLEEPGLEEGAVIRARVFGDIIEKAGYWCGIYANLNWWENYLNGGLERFTKWVAQYYKECQYKGANLDIWQYTSKGSVPGINGSVDMNECYRDFPLEIAGKGTLRPVEIPAPKPIFKSIDDLVEEVLDGKWGNGDDRKNRLTAAGHDYNAVQEAVNKKLEAEVWHTILEGETLSEIAEIFGTTVSELVKLNGIKTPNLIYAGHKIRIK